MSSQPLKVLIVGAGEIGDALLRGFVQHGGDRVNVTVLLRPGQDPKDERKQQQIRAIETLKASVVFADLAASTADGLANIFKAFDLVISATGFAAGRGTQLKICQAALQAKVNRFIPWQFGIDYDLIGRGSAQDLFDEQLDVRDMLRAQAIAGRPHTEWVIVSSGMFTSFIFESYFGVVEPRKGGEVVVRALGSWENQVTLTTAEDIGSLTAQIVVADDTAWDSVVYVAGDTVSYKQVADAIEGALAKTKRSVRRELWDMSYLQSEFAKDPKNEVNKYRVVFGQGTGASWPLSATWNHKHKVKTTSLTQWLESNSSVLDK
ncbi:hypothetical protein Poli38472_001256 [Pythium oligandrum]|uniref:NmrA-like domain-containing protein n=1 Tax=Pythium oligandrum TaxID=41045 RepID=A0A8K1CT45_PYTOL|nr:hypothetical protein Poli38472_001256 [Pythium oligandrum]|eukprot:TMW69100.1 hypothetical protein Poli38472_001256 [Pythium oligandrum]